MIKNPPVNAVDTVVVGSIPGSGRSPGGGNGDLVQQSCWEKFMDRGGWQATAWGSKSQTRLNNFTFTFRLVIAFLPRSKRHLISWMQSPSEILKY